jgi:hypothetical protein
LQNSLLNLFSLKPALFLEDVVELTSMLTNKMGALVSFLQIILLVEDERNQVDHVPYQEPISPKFFQAITFPGTKKSQNFVSRNLIRNQ